MEMTIKIVLCRFDSETIIIFKIIIITIIVIQLPCLRTRLEYNNNIIIKQLNVYLSFIHNNFKPLSIHRMSINNTNLKK